MSRDDESEEERARRRTDRWWEDENGTPYLASRPRISGRSDVVTMVGFVTLLLGSLVLLVGLYGGAGIFIFEVNEMNRAAGGNHGAIVLGLLIFLVISLWGGGAVASGMGVIGRRAWARVLTLILAGFGALAGLLAIAIWYVAMIGAERNFSWVSPDTFLFLGVILLGYSLLICLILLRSSYAQEFR